MFWNNKKKTKQMKVIPPNGTSMPPQYRILVAALLHSHYLASSFVFCPLSSGLCILPTIFPTSSPDLCVSFFFYMSQSFFLLISYCPISHYLRIRFKFKVVFPPHTVSLTCFPRCFFFLPSCWGVCTAGTHWGGHCHPSDLLPDVASHQLLSWVEDLVELSKAINSGKPSWDQPTVFFIWGLCFS